MIEGIVSVRAVQSSKRVIKLSSCHMIVFLCGNYFSFVFGKEMTARIAIKGRLISSTTMSITVKY